MDEIWEITNPNWRLPVGLKWTPAGHGLVELGAGVPLLKAQRSVLRQTLLTAGWEANGKIFIYKPKLIVLGKKMDGADPEDLVMWAPKLMNVDDPEAESEDETEFLQNLCDYGWIKDVEVARGLWAHITKTMLDWILVKGRPLDLKFVTLYAVPFRPNWKEIVRHQTKNGNPSHISKDDKLRHDCMETMIRPELLFHSKQNGLIYHTVEVIHRHWFWTQVRKMEQTRKETYPDKYWHMVLNRMKEALEYAFPSFISYLQETRHPFPFTSIGGDESDKELPENWNRIQGRLEEVFQPDFIPDAIDRATGEIQERCVEGLDEQKEGMPTVPDL